jgi:hypothetical protein
VGLIDSKVSGSRNVGALVGFIDDAATVSNSYATGSVSGSSNVGGLVGENESAISNGHASSSVSGTSNLGGLVGWNNAGTISNSYATGGVSGGNSIGGLVGYNNNGGKVDNTYAMGRVTGSSAVGGLVGYEGVSGEVSNGFWNVTTSGRSTSAGGTPLTTAQMQSAASFTGFHFTTTPGACDVPHAGVRVFDHDQQCPPTAVDGDEHRRELYPGPGHECSGHRQRYRCLGQLGVCPDRKFKHSFLRRFRWTGIYDQQYDHQSAHGK